MATLDEWNAGLVLVNSHASAAEAATKAVAAFNIENGYGPKDDGGFEAVTVASKSDLHRLIAELEARDKQTH